MDKKVSLKTMQCPTCGGSLKVEQPDKPIVCVYCGNTVMPVNEPVVEKEHNETSNVLKVEGIKTSSSALAYIEDYFDDYDWESFVFDQSLSLYEIDELADNLKVSSADDKNTWIFAFKACYIPYKHKIDTCENLLLDLVDDFKDDSLDAYSKFDTYRRVSSTIISSRDYVVSQLKKNLDKASKYGASNEEIKQLQSYIDGISNDLAVKLYDDIEDIEQIKEYAKQKEETVSKQLLEKGIIAEDEYQNGNKLLDEHKYVDALNIFLSLEGYKDSKAIAYKIDKYFLFSNVLKIDDKFYYYQSDNDEFGNQFLNLHSTNNAGIENEPIIKNIGTIITNYADIIYYIDTDKQLCKYSLSDNKFAALSKERFSLSEILVYSKLNKVYLTSLYGKEKSVYELDLSTSNVKPIIKGVNKTISITGNKLLFIDEKKVKNKNAELQNYAPVPAPTPDVNVSKNDFIDKIKTILEDIVNKVTDLFDDLLCKVKTIKDDKNIKVDIPNLSTERLKSLVLNPSDDTSDDTVNMDSNISSPVAAPEAVAPTQQYSYNDDYLYDIKKINKIYNIDTEEIIEIGGNEITIVGYLGNNVIYTIDSPNSKNMSLFMRDLSKDGVEKLIERNIYRFCDVIGDKIFYYIGNSSDITLISIDPDGSNRREFPLYISSMLFKQGSWIYFIRSSGYNSILCRSHIDGSCLKIISVDINEFIDIKNGYLYYLDDDNSLIKVRMDGSNESTLCTNVEKVLSIKEDKIIFISHDDSVESANHKGNVSVKSIYAIDFNGTGRIKLAYDVDSGAEFDSNLVYYITSRTEENKDDYYDNVKVHEYLNMLDVNTNTTKQLLCLDVKEKEVVPQVPKKTNLWLIFGIVLFVSIICFIIQIPFLGFVGLIASVVLGLKAYNDSNKNNHNITGI